MHFIRQCPRHYFSSRMMKKRYVTLFDAHNVYTLGVSTA